MSLTKEMWIGEVEKIQDDYAGAFLTKEEAAAKLKRMGFDSEEADDLLIQMDEV